MRFSEFDKLIIRELTNATRIEDRSLFKYIYDDTSYTAIVVDKSYEKITIHFKNQDCDEVKVWDELSEMIFLLRRLEHNLLIGIYAYSETDKNLEFYNKKNYAKDESGKYYGLTKLGGRSAIIGYRGMQKTYNSNIGRDLVRFANSYFYVSQELRELVKNNFISEEEQRFKKQQCLTIAAIGVSILIGIASLVFNYIGISSDPSDKINLIEKSNSKISNTLESIKSDTERKGDK